ncbi:hypothetical protein ABEB36_013329 [Hypothenemus hampei]
MIKCPHRIEPHQIQGLDFIHIFPVIQWLLKGSMEARQEKCAFIRSYSINQYDKLFPSKTQSEDSKRNIENNIKIVEEAYGPRRYYKRKNAPPPDLLSRVQITLLEYGFRGDQKSFKQSDQEKDTNTIKSLEEHVEEEEKRKIDQFIADLTVANKEILQDEELTKKDKDILIKHYKELHFELKDGGVRSKEEQQISILEEQYYFVDKTIEKLKEKNHQLQEDIKKERERLSRTQDMLEEAHKSLKAFEEQERQNPSAVKEIEELVILNDNLKKQEVSFKESCKKEMLKLETEIGEFKQIMSPVEVTPQQQKEIEELSEKIKLVRLQLAKKNQIVAKLERQLDDIPNRAEMTQYQRRFLELYNQVAAKHKETKQYYTLYNTLEDKRRYMQKELSLLNSVAENYPSARESSSGKEEFLTQLNNIVDSLKQNRFKIEKQVLEEKRKRDNAANSLQNLLELQRTYATAIKELGRECKNYEVLLARKKDSPL